MLDFGLFDDSFMHANHGGYNEDMWNLFGHATRFLRAPHGGELSYYTNADQRGALDPSGLHGRTYEELSARFHISYMIGNDQPEYRSEARIREAGMANGYRFQILAFEVAEADDGTRVARATVTNTGIAPIYYDAYVAVNGSRARESLKGLAPGASQEVELTYEGDPPTLTLECDRLVAGQSIQFDAAL